MKLHKFRNDYFSNGTIKYYAGAAYKPNDETTVAVAAGHAEEVEGKSACEPFTREPAAAPAPPPVEKGAPVEKGKGKDE